MRIRDLVGLAVAALVVTPPVAATAQPPYPPAIFLLNYSRYGAHPPSDYRPSIDPSGTRVVYERTKFDDATHQYPSKGEQLVAKLNVSDIRLQFGPDSGISAPRPLYGDKVAYRADWCPQQTATSDGLISFSTEDGIFVVDPDLPGSLRRLDGTKGLFYPAWYPYCHHIAVKQALGVNGGPSDLAIDARTGAIVKQLSGESTWAGFVSVSQANARLVVFAGQPVGATPYDENMNYIYLADQSKSPPKVMPLDPRTPINSRFDPRFQGRAPTFSPDGSWVAFESNRPPCNGSQTNYALFIQRTDGLTPARQVTDCSYNAQHARWMPTVPGTSRTVLIAAALQPGITPPAFGVAAFDITPFIPPP